MLRKPLKKLNKKLHDTEERHFFDKAFMCNIVAQNWLEQRALAHLLSNHFPNAKIECLSNTADITAISSKEPTLTLWSPEGIDGIDILSRHAQQGHSIIALGTPAIYAHHPVVAQWLPEWQASEEQLLGAVIKVLKELFHSIDNNGRKSAKVEFTRKNKITILTARQNEVLDKLANGFSNAEIAKQLEMSENTVRIHVSAILRTLQLNNRTQAALWAKQNYTANSSEKHR
jgi:DNA-binding CsgD family transcriptional regulator